MGMTEELYLEQLRRLKEGDEYPPLPHMLLGAIKAVDDHVEDLRERVKTMEESVLSILESEERPNGREET